MMSEVAAASTITFQSDFFKSFSEVYFRVAEDGEPVAVLTLSPTCEAVVPFANIRKQFRIPDNSPDGQMLNKIAEGLHYVVALKSGEALPNELTSGAASWTPQEHHFILAKHRLTLQLVTWVTGEEHIFSSASELMMLAEDPKTKQTITVAFGDAAEKLGLDRSDHDSIIHRIEQIAHELAHIEALRERFAGVKEMGSKIDLFRSIYSSDQMMRETASQVYKLFQRCIEMFSQSFDEVDAQTGEIMAILKNIDNQIGYIRKSRDDLYCRLRPWEDICARWKSVYTVKSPESSGALSDLYRFLAPRYMVVRDWVLLSQLKMDKTKAIGGILRW